MADAFERLPGLPDEPDARSHAIEQLRAAWAEAQARWPGVAWDVPTHVGALLESMRDTPDLGAALSACVLVDTLLVNACATGAAGAALAFTGEYAAVWRRAFAGASDPDDLEQTFVTRMLVGQPDRPARIGAFEGRGSLRVWVRVAAVRHRIDAERSLQARPVAAATDVSRVAEDAVDPELAFLKTHYRAAFREAFAQAWDELEPRQRNVVRLRVIDELDNGQIAVALSIHRATVKRWLAEIRTRLLERTRGLLADRLRLADAELDSVLQLVASRFEVTARVFLRTRAS